MTAVSSGALSRCTPVPLTLPLDLERQTPSPPLKRRVLHGTAIHSKSLTEIEYLRNTLIGVDENGVIAFLERDVEAGKIEEIVVKHGWSLDDSETERVSLKRGEFLIPG
jgi:guanine deaminase